MLITLVLTILHLSFTFGHTVVVCEFFLLYFVLLYHSELYNMLWNDGYCSFVRYFSFSLYLSLSSSLSISLRLPPQLDGYLSIYYIQLILCQIIRRIWQHTITDVLSHTHTPQLINMLYCNLFIHFRNQCNDFLNYFDWIITRISLLNNGSFLGLFDHEVHLVQQLSQIVRCYRTK